MEVLRNLFVGIKWKRPIQADRRIDWENSSSAVTLCIMFFIYAWLTSPKRLIGLFVSRAFDLILLLAHGCVCVCTREQENESKVPFIFNFFDRIVPTHSKLEMVTFQVWRQKCFWTFQKNGHCPPLSIIWSVKGFRVTSVLTILWHWNIC